MKETNRPSISKQRKATTPEGREDQIISKAYDLAEQRIIEGTATSQEICYFLKMGSSKERLEKEIMSLQKELIVAKTESLQASKRSEELFVEAIKAFSSYSGTKEDEEEDDYDEE